MESKKIGKVYQTNSSRKEADTAQLISDKIEFKARSNIRVTTRW